MADADRGREFLDQSRKAAHLAAVPIEAARAAKANPGRIRWRELAQQQPPPRRWAVTGWLGFGHITLLVGPGGIGKTLLAQQLASALALGQPFIDDVEGPHKVLAWHCEDDHDELWRRQVPIARWLEAGLEAFEENLVIVPRHGQENALIVSEFGRVMFTPLIEELRTQAGDYGADVVILDNVAQLFGGSENDRHAVTAFMNALAGALPGKAVLLLAHPARAAGSEYSGSSAWENVARTRLYLGAKLPDEKQDQDEPPQEEVRFLARRKANYSAKDWRRLTYRDGVLIPDIAELSGGIVAHIRDQTAERLVFEGLKRLQGMSIWPTETSNSPRFLPRLLVDHKFNDGRTKAELAAALRRLRNDGKLTVGKVGTYTNRNPMQGLMATP